MKKIISETSSQSFTQAEQREMPISTKTNHLGQPTTHSLDIWKITNFRMITEIL